MTHFSDRARLVARYVQNMAGPASRIQSTFSAWPVFVSRQKERQGALHFPLTLFESLRRWRETPSQPKHYMTVRALT